MAEDSHLRAWEKDYRSRSRLWGGSAKAMPTLHLPGNARVLELGCGSGKTLTSMDSSWQVVALDISPAALELCRPLVAGLQADLLRAHACNLPFQSRSFSAVFAFHLLGHLLDDERQKSAREIARVLAQDGMLFLREFCRDDFRAGKGAEVEPWTFQRAQGTVTHYFTEAEVAGLFPELKRVSLSTHCWKMRVRGQDLGRSEVQATFVKS
jgi:SAM-dependent methyltransferase